MRQLTALEKIVVLQNEIVLLKSRLGNYDTGHLYTTINVLEQRIAELEAENINEQKQRNR